MSNAAHIRTLFLHPHPAYPLPDAAALLGVSGDELRGWVEAGELEGVDTDDGLVLSWAEVVSFGMELWSQEVVEEALGSEVAEALPELLRLTDLEVRIPRMEVVALERLAALDGETVSAVLARELLDLVSVHSAWLSDEVPGFAAAFAWPEVAEIEPRAPGRGGAGATSKPSSRVTRWREADTLHDVSAAVCAFLVDDGGVATMNASFSEQRSATAASWRCAPECPVG